MTRGSSTLLLRDAASERTRAANDMRACVIRAVGGLEQVEIAAGP